MDYLECKDINNFCPRDGHKIHFQVNDTENEEFRSLIREAVERLQMPPMKIRGDGFRELMGRLRSV